MQVLFVRLLTLPLLGFPPLEHAVSVSNPNPKTHCEPALHLICCAFPSRLLQPVRPYSLYPMSDLTGSLSRLLSPRITCDPSTVDHLLSSLLSAPQAPPSKLWSSKSLSLSNAVPSAPYFTSRLPPLGLASLELPVPSTVYITFGTW